MKSVFKKHIYRKSCGVAIIAALIFIAIFSALAISMAALSTTNVQISSEQHQVNNALAAAQSGLDCGRYLIAQTITTLAGMPLMNTTDNFVTAIQADTVWATLYSQVQNAVSSGKTISGKTVPDISRTPKDDGYQIAIPFISYGSNNSEGFTLIFYRPDSDPNTIELQSTGTDGQVTRYASIGTSVTKSADVLKYAVATRSRMWITGDSTIHGDIFSAWNLSKSQLATLATNPGALTTMTAPSISPFNVTSDSEVEGTINTCWSKDQIKNKSWQLETLDAQGNPMYDEDGNKIISSEDEIQGQCDGINYGVPPQNMSGMKISDYDTTIYYNKTRIANGGSGDIYYSSSATNYTGNLDNLPDSDWNGKRYRYERFPHDAGSYTTGSGIQVKRYIYKNQTFDNVRLPDDKNALFINCTFNDVMYVDCGQSTSTNNFNNVRFDNCTFNGTIVSDTPQSFNWQKNTLYFTGSATFQNTSADATILAPHFNVNLGNTNPVAGTDNVLRGAIVGGIVDVRGNAEVFGTIISMADTSSYTSGYVTNIGATLNDGGSETVAIGDVGTINITPDPAKMLPSGITTPIIIKPMQETYTEN